ncbi:MAG: heparinase II/III family protein [Cyclobacteriaceae bacterium]
MNVLNDPITVFRSIFLFVCISISVLANAQIIPSDRVLEVDALEQYLKTQARQGISKKKNLSTAELADYFRNKFSERFFYNWETVLARFELYDQTYGNRSGHEDRAKDHMTKYADSTTWVLPFEYLNGEPVNAYALRHLARQHKMVDIALQYFYDGKNPKYINYFTRQMRSLNMALEKGKYEKIEDGNGVYEAFRSGYRVLNWLSIHNLFLGEKAYSDKDQLLTLATLLQHGAHLYSRNASFKSGNHQTRGVSALAMLAIVFRDFEGTDLWFDRAMTRLEEHLDKEINGDGFQFERSIHYHMSDIANYYYVYQLAKISGIPISQTWENRLRSLFTTLVRIAYPDRSAPVLQDDTEIPWAEKNDISGAMTLGYLLFKDETFGYFAKDHVEDRMYWFLQQSQLDLLQNIESKNPNYGSEVFEETGYYVMREGWAKNDKMMIISAGLDAKKPDHQHGDMLGIQAMSSGQVILPNYQVRYSLPDYDFFKNSLVKNVALLDEELQGRAYKGNKGGSGFGKFGDLPEPKVITWQSNETFDLFVGSHDGFDRNGVEYSRQVIFVKNDYWIVKDNFNSSSTHEYKQVWQGHYSFENAPNLLRSTFDNGSGCDIYQLNRIDEYTSDGKRGKEWSVVSKSGQSEFSFITVIYPYSSYDRRLDESVGKNMIGNWKIGEIPFEVTGPNFKTLGNDGKYFVFDLEGLTIDRSQVIFSESTDIHIELEEKTLNIYGLGDEPIDVSIKDSTGTTLNKMRVEGDIKMQPGDLLVIDLP